jgi:hypothetical protein
MRCIVRRKGDQQMSMYYSSKMVKLLMEERLREAQDARRLRAGGRRGSLVPSQLRRLFVRTPAPATCAC